MMKNRKKFLALFLAGTLLFSNCAVPVIAEDITADQEISQMSEYEQNTSGPETVKETSEMQKISPNSAADSKATSESSTEGSVNPSPADSGNTEPKADAADETSSVPADSENTDAQTNAADGTADAPADSENADSQTDSSDETSSAPADSEEEIPPADTGSATVPENKPTKETENIPDAPDKTAASPADNGIPEETSPKADLPEDNTPVIRVMSMVLQKGDAKVSSSKFKVYKDAVASGTPDSDVTAGELSITAPDLTGDDLYFDYAAVNGKRIYEVGTLDTITYYSSSSGALSILEEGETIDLYYISKYKIQYTGEVSKTFGDELVEKGNALTFRAKPSGKGKRLKVMADGTDISHTGTLFDKTAGELLFTIADVTHGLNIEIQEENAVNYTLTCDRSGIRNGQIMSYLPKLVEPNGNVSVSMISNRDKRYVLNLLVINDYEVTSLPSNASAGTSVSSVLPSGEEVTVTLTSTDPDTNVNNYEIKISNVYTDLCINEVNFKLADRNEIIIKELAGIEKIVGWDDEAPKGWDLGNINSVFLQTTGSGNEFYFNLTPGYKDPRLIVRTNGREISASVPFGPNPGLSFSSAEYQYRFDFPNNLGDNVELFLNATPINYTVEYRNDKNEDDLIGTLESGFTVESGNKDIITITSREPYETVAGLSPDGYIVKGGPRNKIYHAGDAVPVEDVIPYASNGIITFLPNWVSIEELHERQITINLFIEDPTSGSYVKAASYLLSVGEGTALLRPDDERGRLYIRNFLTNSDVEWNDTYRAEDFVLKASENTARIVKENEQSLDFHYDVKKGTLKVVFEWGTGETPEPNVLPDPVTESFAIKQNYQMDISRFIPENYTASMKIVTGSMIAGEVSKTVYLYKDTDKNDKPDNFTISLTFDAQTDGVIANNNLTPGGDLTSDGKNLTYHLIKEGAAGFQADKYPAIPTVTVTETGKVWMGWSKDGLPNPAAWYSNYANKTVPQDASSIQFLSSYGVASGYKTVTINYYKKLEDGTFSMDHSMERYGKPNDKIQYPRSHIDGYIIPEDGTPGDFIVTDTDNNTVDVYYYLDKDQNGKPDAFTLTLHFKGTGKGSWDSEDPLWQTMQKNKDYIYQNGVLHIFLTKENTAGFAAENYPDSPKVNAEETWLFDSWQNGRGKSYGSGPSGDGITIGEPVKATDTDKNYTTVYDKDLNKDGIPDDEQSVSVVFKDGEHGVIDGQKEFTNLLPGLHSYPKAPDVTADPGYVFAGWEPAYTKSGVIEENAERNQEYKVVFKEDRNGNGQPDKEEPTYQLIYDGNAQNGGQCDQIPADSSLYLTAEKAVLDSRTIPIHTDVNGMSVLFVGWSAEQTTKIYSRETASELAKISLLTEVAFTSKNETVYAVWSYDMNEDQNPDAFPYILTVENGSGDGKYAENSAVSIKADTAPRGKVFDKWVSSNGGIFADEKNPETTFTMPGNDVTVTAVYKAKKGGGKGGSSETEASSASGSSSAPAGTAQDISVTIQSPKTGDDTSLLLWFIILILSGTGIVKIHALKKKKEHTNNTVQ